MQQCNRHMQRFYNSESPDIISPAGPWSAPGSPPGWACPEHLPREMPRRHPDQILKPPQLAPLDAEEQQLYSEPLPRCLSSSCFLKGWTQPPCKGILSFIHTLSVRQMICFCHDFKIPRSCVGVYYLTQDSAVFIVCQCLSISTSLSIATSAESRPLHYLCTQDWSTIQLQAQILSPWHDWILPTLIAILIKMCLSHIQLLPNPLPYLEKKSCTSLPSCHGVFCYTRGSATRAAARLYFAVVIVCPISNNAQSHSSTLFI